MVTLPDIVKLFCNVAAPDQVPPDKIIVAVPEQAPFIVKPAQVRVSLVVQFNVFVEEKVSVPEIVQLPESVLVLLPVNETGPGNVFPPLVIVDEAEIVIAPVPLTVQLCAVLSVKLPEIVKVTAVFIVTV